MDMWQQHSIGEINGRREYDNETNLNATKSPVWVIQRYGVIVISSYLFLIQQLWEREIKSLIKNHVNFYWAKLTLTNK